MPPEHIFYPPSLFVYFNCLYSNRTILSACQENYSFLTTVTQGTSFSWSDLLPFEQAFKLKSSLYLFIQFLNVYASMIVLPHASYGPV